MLSIQEDGKTAFEFLASVGEEVPVYRMQDGQCVSCVTADVPPQKMQMVVLALNNAGTAWLQSTSSHRRILRFVDRYNPRHPAGQRGGDEHDMDIHS
ncbi:MAG: hypothetical protein ACLSB9_21935 [Hydrogeniiclostridium mannosilyticum]